MWGLHEQLPRIMLLALPVLGAVGVLLLLSRLTRRGGGYGILAVLIGVCSLAGLAGLWHLTGMRARSHRPPWLSVPSPRVTVEIPQPEFPFDTVPPSVAQALQFAEAQATEALARAEQTVRMDTGGFADEFDIVFETEGGEAAAITAPHAARSSRGGSHLNHAVRIKHRGSRHHRESIVWTGLMGIAIAALLYLGYLFLDAGTRGHFTWSLRILSAVALAAILAAVTAFRHGL